MKAIMRFFTTVTMLVCFHCSFVLAQTNIILEALDEELNRSLTELKEKGEAPLYYLGYTITDKQDFVLTATFGALYNKIDSHVRFLDIDIRVGDYKFDNTHELRGGYSSLLSLLGSPAARITIENDIDAIKNVIWRETDKAFKNEQKQFTNLKTNVAVKVEEEDQSDDFSIEPPQIHSEAILPLKIDEASWVEKLKSFSAMFKESPHIYTGQVTLEVNRLEKFIIDSEGTKLQTGHYHIWIRCLVRTIAEDGMSISLNRIFFAPNWEKVPSDEEIRQGIRSLISELEQMKEASYVEPYIGPAILLNRASAVFFHEIFGHRVEGHRQKSVLEGQTFAKKVGEFVLPEFINIYDDPSLESYGEFDLAGHYNYDDEGVKASRVSIVEEGVLKNFLMSRSPIEGFSNSNGHGRRDYGRKTVARQGNLVIESSNAVAFDELKKLLIEECNKQDKPYGLIFTDISGGFTTTQRIGPQSFKVIPLVVYKVYADGRPDELVRGVDIVGTPLTSFSKIIATSNDYNVFNGFCGAESGSLPVSCISPSMLVSEIEVEKKIRAQDKPPILPSPIHKKIK